MAKVIVALAGAVKNKAINKDEKTRDDISDVIASLHNRAANIRIATEGVLKSIEHLDSNHINDSDPKTLRRAMGRVQRAADALNEVAQSMTKADKLVDAAVKALEIKE